MKAFWAKFLAWGQLAIVALDQSIAAHGVPSKPSQWLAILGSAVLALAIHGAASTDGTK